MGTSADDVLVFDIGTIVGPVFIANLINWLLMGTLVMQIYTYYQLFPKKDVMMLRVLVNFLFLLDVAQTAILTHHGWFTVVTSWSVAANLDIIPWSASMIPIFCGLVSLLVQLFYSWRIWILSPNQVLRGAAILISLIAFVQAGGAISTGFLSMHPPTVENLRRIHPEITLWLAGSLGVDILVTLCMSYILTRGRRRSGWTPTETLLTKLIHRIIQTGAASAIVAAIDIVMYIGFPSRNYHFVPAYILGKVYSNSLMLTLNLRRPTAEEHSSQTAESKAESFRNNIQSRHRAPGGVHITQTVDVDSSSADIWAQKENQEDNIHLVNIPHMKNLPEKPDAMRAGTEAV
ncbi:hypothetical protein B0H16DRAFT_1558164 [Mycena metata]|uniref:DUF6534 domain-containing protein n=1 Tax=Mycena metata TaxID=1033252 RepID=A0AAD7INE6_9AGAR|nr:hypothetical protein B0H16DRAFT_1558164 [Mycena metata]